MSRLNNDLSKTSRSTRTCEYATCMVCLQSGRPGFDPWDGKIPWRRKWQPTPVLLPGKSHGQRSLVDYTTITIQKFKMPSWVHFLIHPHLCEHSYYLPEFVFYNPTCIPSFLKHQSVASFSGFLTSLLTER